MDPQAEVRARLRQKEAQSGRGERRPVQPRGALKSEKNDEAAKEFEEQRRAWREKRAASLAANSDSVGGADAEDAMIAKARNLQQENLDSLAKSLQMAKQATDVGQETLIKLTAQREQMRKMDDDLDKANESLNRSERVIRGMKSTFGGITNWFTKPKEHVSHKLDKNIKVPGDATAEGEEETVGAGASRRTADGLEDEEEE